MINAEPVTPVGQLTGGLVLAGGGLTFLSAGAGAVAAGPAILAVGAVFLGGYLIARGTAGIIQSFY